MRYRNFYIQNRHLFALLSAIAVLAPSSTFAQNDGRISIIAENDNFASNDDRHYTNGLRFSYLSPAIASDSGWNNAFETFNSFTPVFNSESGVTRHTNWIIGQSLFTPEKTQLTIPDPKDRPYAGWMYGGIGLIQDNNSQSLDNIELLLGVVGPAAAGRQTQNDFHQFILQPTAKGWDYQLKNEPGAMLSFNRTWRYHSDNLLPFAEAEFLPEAGATLGNVMTYANVGGIVRMGKNLKADYGQARIRPALSGTDYFNADKMNGDFGYSLFAGVQGRAVAQNIFLDGNTWSDSPSVDKKNYVADIMFGGSLFWSEGIKIDVMAMQRSKEFEGQRNPDKFGGVNVTFNY